MTCFLTKKIVSTVSQYKLTQLKLLGQNDPLFLMNILKLALACRAVIQIYRFFFCSSVPNRLVGLPAINYAGLQLLCSTEGLGERYVMLI